MNNLPTVALGIITYNRFDELCATIEAYQQHLIYPADKLVWVLHDDGSPGDYVERVEKRFPGLFASVLQSERGGMPVSWNRMNRMCHQLSDYVWPCQDDWLLTEPLDLRLGVAFLIHNERYGMVRYHKLTGHVGLPMIMKEWDTRGILNYDDGANEYAPWMCTFLDLIPPFDESDTYSPYSGGCHLRHRRFTQYYGEYNEGARFSNAEMTYMAIVNSGLRRNPDVVPRVAMFDHYIHSRFLDQCAKNSYRDTQVERETLK
jgi:hypothetical protein